MIARFFLLTTLVFSGQTAFAAQTASWQLVYSSNFQGELKPCGCTEEGDLGGILRRATKFSQLRALQKDTVIVSAGDILGATTEQGIIKNRYMLEGHRHLGLDAILPGERDLAHPRGSLINARLPWVLSNTTDSLPFPAFQRRILSSGHRILVFGLLDPNLVSTNAKRWLAEPRESLHDIIAKTHASPEDTVILLTHGGKTFAEKFKKIKLVDVIIRGHLDAPVTEVKPPPGVPVLSAGHRGQRIGVAEFESNTITRLKNNRVIPLPKSIAEHPDLARLYERYDNEIAIWYRKKTARMKKVGKATHPFATATICRACHLEIHAAWQASGHAKAISSLRRAGKQEDPECLFCHTTGMNTPGGFIAETITPDLINVQCEACHGAARNHTEYPLASKPEKAAGSCPTCHTRESSPKFTPESYWPKIVHPMKSASPIHRQQISKVLGIYDILDPDEPLLTRTPIVVTEYFNFYCSRCFVLNSVWPSLTESLSRSIVHRQIPVVFGDDQQPWSAIAYLVAERADLGAEVKKAMFEAKFTHAEDIGDKQVIINIAKRFGLGKAVRRALETDTSEFAEVFMQGMAQKERQDVHVTPTVIINDNVQVSPEHTGNNTNLMMENLQEILQDIQCRQTGMCN